MIYADPKCLIEKTDECKNNPENSSTIKVGKHIPSYFQCLQYHYLKTWMMNDVGRGKDCMENMILKFLLNNQMKWMTTKILKNINQIKNV